MRRERGHAPAIEAAIIIPGILLVVGVIVVLAHVVLARQELHAVASPAARAAALERSWSNAEQQAAEVIDRGLGESGLACTERGVVVASSGGSAPLGEESTVTVRLRCTVELSDVSLPLLPGSTTIEVETVSPVDRFRAR